MWVDFVDDKNVAWQLNYHGLWILIGQSIQSDEVIKCSSLSVTKKTNWSESLFHRYQLVKNQVKNEIGTAGDGL